MFSLYQPKPVVIETTNSKKLILEKNLSDYNNKDVVYNESTLYFNAYFPFTKKGYRVYIPTTELTSLVVDVVTNLVVLNPTAQDDIIINYIYKSIEKKYLNNYSEYKIYNIIEKIRKLYSENELTPVNLTVKKYWVNPDVENKIEAYRQKRSEISLEIINYFFENDLYYYNEKITYSTIAQNTGLSEVTIKRRLTPNQKQIIKNHNRNLND